MAESCHLMADSQKSEVNVHSIPCCIIFHYRQRLCDSHGSCTQMVMSWGLAECIHFSPSRSHSWQNFTFLLAAHKHSEPLPRSYPVFIHIPSEQIKSPLNIDHAGLERTAQSVRGGSYGGRASLNLQCLRIDGAVDAVLTRCDLCRDPLFCLGPSALPSHMRGVRSAPLWSPSTTLMPGLLGRSQVWPVGVCERLAKGFFSTHCCLYSTLNGGRWPASDKQGSFLNIHLITSPKRALWEGRPCALY